MKPFTNDRVDTWTEMEERRRLWWAVLILDRYVHIGFRFRPLSTPKIPPEEILPARDAAWDIGVSINDCWYQDLYIENTDSISRN